MSTCHSHSWATDRRTRGFTLIEVIGALVIFSVGVLMVMQVGGALTTQMRYAGARSEIVVLANEVLDSVEAIPLGSVAAGNALDTLNVQGWAYQRSLTVTDLTPVLFRVEVELTAVDSAGPSYAVTSYTSAVW